MTLSSLSVAAFKCFSELELPLASLTLLSGFNAAGKSTALQSLLLIRNGLRSSPNSRSISLNSPSVRLGKATDVFTRGTDRNLVLGVMSNDENVRWEFALGATDPMAEDSLGSADRDRLELESVSLDGSSVGDTQMLPSSLRDSELLRTVHSIVYLGATRQGPLDVYPSPEDADVVRGDVGHEGQYAAWWYANIADEILHESRRFPGDERITFRAHIDSWLGHLFPGAEASAERLRGTGLTRLSFKNSRASEWLRPANTGYGLTYVFPLIVALLTAKAGQVVIVDSPEAHLHPRAQSRMGEMLSRFAAAGVQILVETHSDHLLAGARLAVQRNLISSERIAIHFFAGPAAEGEPGVTSPVIDAQGNLSDWPEGFFDQADNDLTALAVGQ